MASTIKLDDLQEIMESLECGEHTLTRDDILLVAQVAAMINHQSCPFGFQEGEVAVVRSVLKRGKWFVYTVGLTVITSMVGGCTVGAWKLTVWLSRLGALDAASKIGGGH